MILQNCRPLQGGNYFLGLLGCSTHPSGVWKSDSWGFEWFLTEGKGNKLNSRKPPLLGMLLWLQLWNHVFHTCECMCLCVPAHAYTSECVCVCTHPCAHMWVRVYVCPLCAQCVCVYIYVCAPEHVYACAHICPHVLPPTYTHTKHNKVTAEISLERKPWVIKALSLESENLTRRIFWVILLLSALPPWTSYQTLPSLSFFIIKWE